MTIFYFLKNGISFILRKLSGDCAAGFFSFILKEFSNSVVTLLLDVFPNFTEIVPTVCILKFCMITGFVLCK
jgi:hypothetical protein